ncbi:Fur family transcriptional regulator [Lysobacteraceae bacterium NML120232]|nr:Fur family transcriptional regulator [Xanthomonadaceae bacterium NML08-0793]PJK10821.1 Fur family transcriptional regulator [Xanthomonadaceae bacterium NML120232]
MNQTHLHSHCTSPEHHVHDVESFITAAENACRERGVRLTPIRVYVLRLIAEAGKPVKAYDLLDQVRLGDGPGAAAPPTVYRALDFLIENGFVHKLESINAFIACHHPNAARHSVPFLICTQCNRAVEMEDVEVAALLEARARALGFKPNMQVLEVHGLCEQCAK